MTQQIYSGTNFNPGLAIPPFVHTGLRLVLRLHHVCTLVEQRRDVNYEILARLGLLDLHLN